VLNSKTEFIGGRLTCVVLSSPALLVSSAVHSISISISNDRVEYSDVISMYIYDSTCMTCTDTGLCTVEVCSTYTVIYSALIQDMVLGRYVVHTVLRAAVLGRASAP